MSFPFGSRTVHLFSPEDVAATRERLQIPVHDDETIRDDFFAFLEERNYSLSYKMPFLLALLDHVDPSTGSAPHRRRARRLRRLLPRPAAARPPRR